MKDLTQTYAAKVGKPTFNWIHELSKKKINESMWDEMSHLANYWPTCACGNQCAVIPREFNSLTGSGAPVDKVLYRLGMTFANQINNHRRADALRTFHRIEVRSLELIREVNKTAAIKLARKTQRLINQFADLGYSPTEILPLSQH